MVNLDQYKSLIPDAIEWLEQLSDMVDLPDEERESCEKLLDEMTDFYEELYGERWSG